MANRVSCQNCGGRVDLPDGFSRPKIRCPGCGYYAEVPVELRGASESAPEPTPAETPEIEMQPRTSGRASERTSSRSSERTPERASEPTAPAKKPATKARRKADPRDTRPDFEPDAPAGVPLLHGTQDEDDDQPYAVPGTGLQYCPHCRGSLPLDATFCVHCGSELTTGAKADRVHQPMAAEWGEGLALLTRYQIMAGMQVLNFVGTLLALNAEGFTSSAIVTNLIFQVMHVALQAFIVGSFDTINLKRNSKGQTTITRTRRIGFIPMKPMKIAWKKSSNLGIVGTQHAGLVEWAVCCYLLLLGILPGVLFYWFVIHPERAQVNLCDEYGSTNEVLYHCSSREKAEDVAHFVVEATGLHYKKVI